MVTSGAVVGSSAMDVRTTGEPWRSWPAGAYRRRFVRVVASPLSAWGIPHPAQAAPQPPPRRPADMPLCGARAGQLRPMRYTGLSEVMVLKI